MKCDDDLSRSMIFNISVDGVTDLIHIMTLKCNVNDGIKLLWTNLLDMIVIWTMDFDLVLLCNYLVHFRM